MSIDDVSRRTSALKTGRYPVRDVQARDVETDMTLTRRGALAAGALAMVAPRAAFGASAALARIERDLGGRLGVAALDVASGRGLGHRDAERFPLCSTFKMLAAALVLNRVDRGEEQLDRQVRFGEADLVPYSPVTELHVGAHGMTLAAICRAAVTRSDNTAGNLMLASFGGPAGLTAFARRLGDGETRLDRIEPHLNEALPGDPRDTTTPAAMALLLRRLLVEDALSAPSRGRLMDWLLANETGDARIRASVPAGWRVGDKTGTGDRGAASDVAILVPPGRPPLLIAVYLHGSTRPTPELSQAIAAAARAVREALAAA